MNYSAQFARRPFPPLRRRDAARMLPQRPVVNPIGWSARDASTLHDAVYAGTYQDRVLHWLIGREPAHTYVIARALGMEGRRVRSALEALFHKGAIRRFGVGMYGVADDESR
ncbi:MAG: hypothetical protein HY323_07125 [Betaproteobacteria bacterium]|nr:hypothetical protein [Betaproteobacteria bacterium]